MNSNVEAVEPVAKMFEHFYVYLYNVRVLFFNKFLWVLDSAGNPGHKGRMQSKDLATGRFLGQGCSGILYETTWSRAQDSTMRLARKDFPGVKGGTFKREAIRLFELSSHPNVVKTLGWTVDGRSCSLVMEYVRDDLSSLMRRKKEAQRKSKGNQLPVIGTSLTKFRCHEALDIAFQIAIGMEYLHDKGITHGDLKPNNVLIDWKDGQPLVKVADFGLIETKRRSTLLSQRALCFRMIEWSAPELFEDYFCSLGEDLDYLWTESPTGSDVSTSCTANMYDCPKILMTKADSYSFALTCAYIFGGQMWDAKLSPSELRRRISIFGLRPKLPSECPKSLVSLISHCWDTHPKWRPTFSFIRNRLQEIIKEQSMSEDAYNLWRSNLAAQPELQEQGTVDPRCILVENEKVDFTADSSQVLELATNLEKVKLVVTEKSEVTGDDGLPSYLNIDPASVEIKAPVRMPERLSNHDDKKTDGWVVVRFGTYLGCEFAMKVFSSGDATWNRSEFLKEVRSLMKLHHPHVVQLMGFAQDEEKCIILMELMDTDLRHFMKPRSRGGKRPFGRSEEMDIITQIARGLLYLHEQGYVHGELKCSNILVKQIGDHVDVKISDLRSSHKLGMWDPVLFKERSFRRRPRWTAPEMTCYGESLEPTHELLRKTDVYSFGMVCFEVLTGKLPFQDVRGEALERRIATGELKQELPGELDGKLRGLIESCWERDPSARPTLEEICHLLDCIRSSEPGCFASQPGFFASVWRRLKLMTAISRNPRTPPEDGGDDPWMTVYERPLRLPDFVRIEPEKLKKERLLGRGASADVHQATWLGCKYASKTYRSTSTPTAVEAEVKFLVELRHPCVVHLIGLSVDQSERRCSIVMEFMGSDLRNLINTRMWNNRTVPFDLHEAVYIITRIALGMAFMHARGVAHRDLKARDVLVPDHPGSIDVKISDFGLSQLIDPEGKLPLGHVGTGFWRAPEVLPSPLEGEEEPLRSHDSLKAADVYSFAMTSYEVLTGRVPLEEEVERLGPAAVTQRVVAGELRPRLPLDLNPALKELIEECWAGEPEKRPTFWTICEKLRQIQLGNLA